MTRWLTFFFCFCCPVVVLAHAGQQGLILLLPTDIYIATGGITIVATILLAALFTHRQLHKVFTPKTLGKTPPAGTTISSLISMMVMFGLIWLGLFGPHDPLANLLSLTIWTLLWVCFIILCGFCGNLWAWFNPWSGLYRILFGPSPETPLALPQTLGQWPALAGLLAFNAYGISNPAAADPIQLAILTSLYWMYTFLMMMLFGSNWLKHGEFITVFIHLIAKIAPFHRADTVSIGVSGWRISSSAPPSFSLAFFAMALLATGTFDGFNETFFWLAQLGINPLAFPGRSAIVCETIVGLIAANILLPLVFYACIRISTPSKIRAEMFRRQSLAILPIALAYHFSHFLPSVMVDIQYTLKALSDPLNSGADYLGLGQFYVTTGFFNTIATQKVIFLSQAGAIVLGHILAILLAHRIATDYFATRRQVLFNQIPLSVFMIGYTVLGLWLLATPKGA